ncbi:uncharacterized protein LOC116180845 isoform X2 [Photinus pyralis]|uniref:uncharacterized protein LOC116180845 isoform X2 n=1 Tax=Photinus pyralis TaxID=7054 RepID=UPI00126761C0|nr:uncharacterized protein LOC116180845 isoform X2 [Photinus pyralis]
MGIQNMELQVGAQKFSKISAIKDTICKIWNGISVEPVLILFALPFWMSSLTIQNLSLEKACRVNLNMELSTCDAIERHNTTGYNDTDEITVHKVVASAYVWKNIIQSVFPAILLPLFGSWSDRQKTMKVLMILPIIGEIVMNIGLILCTFFFYELPMEVNVLVEVLPTAITGGSNMILLGVFTYVTSVCDTKNRTLRIGIIHTTWFVCITIGNSLSGVMYKLIGFYGIFALSLVGYALAGLYAHFLVSEISSGDEKQLTTVQHIKDILNVKQTMYSFKFLVTAKQSGRLKQILTIMILAVLVLGPFAGESAVRYLYVRFKFGWGEIDFSIFTTYCCIVAFVGNIIAIATFKLLNYDDGLLGALSSISKICGGIIYVLSTTPLMFYLAAIAEIFNGTAFVASRSIITKLVDQQDLCKVNSLFGFAESLTGLICGPMYSALYKGTISYFPQAFFLASICITVPAVLLYMWLYSKRNVRFQE